MPDRTESSRLQLFAGLAWGAALALSIVGAEYLKGRLPAEGISTWAIVLFVIGAAGFSLPSHRAEYAVPWKQVLMLSMVLVALSAIVVAGVAATWRWREGTT